MINNSDKKEYKKYFDLKATSNVTSATQRISHGFNIIKTSNRVYNRPWHTYDLVSDNLYLGQIPNVCMTKDFDTTIFPNKQGLVVACNSLYELADIGSAVSVISPTTFQNKGIDHHHLPFTDFSTDANDGLVATTLTRMLQARVENKPIYVHCKAGRSRSGMIVSLYQILTQDEYAKALNNIFKAYDLSMLNKNNMDKLLEALENLIKNVEKDIKKKRPQIDLGKKAKQAANLLLAFKQNGQLSFDNNKIKFDLGELRQSFESKEDYLNSTGFLNDIAQSSAFKALGMYALTTNSAYKTSNRFFQIKCLFDYLYENPVECYQVLDAVMNQNAYEFKGARQAEMACNLRKFMNAKPVLQTLTGSDADKRKQLLDNLTIAIGQCVGARVSNENDNQQRFALKNSNNNIP